MKTYEQFLTETGAGPLVFLPLLEQLGIVKAIASCGFPATSQINDVQSEEKRKLGSDSNYDLLGSDLLGSDSN